MPFLLPLYAALMGVIAGYFFGRLFKERVRLGTRGFLFVGLVIAVAAIAASSAQGFYDLGLSMQNAFLAESIALLVFCFTLAWAWPLLQTARARWFLIAAVPFGLAQPILVLWMFISWSLNGFAP